jgi:flagellar protein FlaI
MREVSQKGSTFTIRKFREDPITIVDMIGFGTLSPEVAAYLWTAIEHKRTILITGVTGSGKTTLLNSILNLVKPNYKIITIEETPEIRLPSRNWVQLVARPSYAAGESRAGEISLYDLVKVSLRYRPDIIVVGEVRGAEAYVLFQSIATGHSGATTIHAENIDAAIKRLTSPPMNIPESYIPLINIALLIERVSIKDSEGRVRANRRVTRIWEVSREGLPILAGKWNPSKDVHELSIESSEILKRVASSIEVDVKDLYEEIYRRAIVMEWLYHKGIRHYRDIASVIYRYYRDPSAVLEKARKDLAIIKTIS